MEKCIDYKNCSNKENRTKIFFTHAYLASRLHVYMILVINEPASNKTFGKYIIGSKI